MTSSASGSPRAPLSGVLAAVLALVGCGGGGGGGSPPMTAPILSLSATSVTFAAQANGTTSAADVITVSNTGTAALTVSGVTIGGVDAAMFADTTTCGSVAAGSSCTISVTYAPTALGAASATLGIAANVTGSPVNVTLSGTGAVATGSNTVTGIVDAGPAALTIAALNLLYVSVQICAPGTTTCQVIDHIQVDTGSFGLRVLSEVLSVPLAAALTTRNSLAGNALLECTQFADGYSWGPIKTADATIGAKVAANLPIQVIGDPAYPDSMAPAACTTGPGGATKENTVANFGANGIIGIGYFLEDCGLSCQSDGTVYSNCTATTCTGYAAFPTEQVPNPVGKFATDNNGVIIQLPDVPTTGGTDITGTLVFGIGTAANNALAPSATVYTVSAFTGSFSAKYAGTTMPDSFVDSGSNAYYFPNVSSLLTACAGVNSSFYCPTPDTTVTAEITGVNNALASVTLPVNNLSEIGAATAFPGLAGTIGGLATTFDFGLPFFFGRTVYVAFEGSTLGGEVAPAIAW